MTNIIVWFYNLRQSRWFWLILGAILGLIVGLIVGPLAFPTQWVNATPLHMRLDFRDNYLVWVAQQYEANRNLSWACQQLRGADYFIGQGETKAVLKEVAEKRQAAGDIAAANSLNTLRGAVDPGCPQLPGGQAGGETPAGGSIIDAVMPFCLIGLLLLLLGGGGFLAYRIISRRREEAGEAMAERVRPVQPAAWGIEGVPLAQYPTTYTLGDDHYDPSFSIEMENGEFMGECGVGISETIGVGAPSKVTAFEVWLFDKSDIRTVTRVLMSDYAYHDEALRTKLAPKGEPVLVGEGKEVILETKTLRVTARLVEVQYGAGNLPPNSFFERLSIDLIAWAKPVPEGMEAEEMVDFDAPVSYG